MNTGKSRRPSRHQKRKVEPRTVRSARTGVWVGIGQDIRAAEPRVMSVSDR